MKKHVFGLLVAVMLCSLAVFGCSSDNSSSNEQTAYCDDQFIVAIEKSYQERSDYISEHEDDDDSGAKFAAYPQVELDTLQEYTAKTFEDSHLQELALSYINALKTQVAACDYYSADYDKYLEEWQEGFDTRSKVLQELIENYGFTVSDKYQDGLKKLTVNAEVVKANEQAQAAAEALAKKVQKSLKGEKKSYSDYTDYKATAKNDTGISFTTISFKISFYNKKGTRIDMYTAYADEWLAGDKIVLDDISCKGSPEKFKVAVDYYEAE